MTGYATAADLAEELGTEPDGQTAKRFTRWLEAVTARIRARIPDLDDRVASGNLDRALVADVVLAVTARHARNPEGLAESQVAVDDGSVRRKWDTGRAPRLEPLPEEWSLLEAPAPTMYSIVIGNADDA